MKKPLRRIIALLLVLFVCFSFVACFETTPETPSGDNPPAGPTEPSDPSNPSDPNEPSDPSDPSGPNVPDAPNEPSDPSDPSQPNEPVIDYNTPASHYYTLYWDPVFGMLSGLCEIQRNADGSIISVSKLLVPLAEPSNNSFSYLNFTSMLLDSGLFYRYDENGRLLSIRYTAAAVGSLSGASLDVIDLSVSYDEQGHPCSAFSKNGNIYCRFLCDDTGRIIKEIWENPGYISVMEYDETGFLTAMSMRADGTSMQCHSTVTSENVITSSLVAYDTVDGELQEDRSQYTITVNDEKKLAKIDAYHLCDADGDGFLEEIHAEYAYNTQGLCTSVVMVSLDGTESVGSSNIAIEYGDHGKIAAITATYNTATTVTEQATFSYDAAGLQSITVQRDSADSYNASFTRDENGRIVLTEKTVSDEYNTQKEWIYAVQDGTFSPVSSTVAYYDADQTLLVKYVYTYTESTWVQSACIYNGQDIEEERSEWSVVFEGGTGRVASSIQATYDTSGNRVSYVETVYTRNAQGRVINAVSTRYNTNGGAVGITEVITYTYNAYGNLTKRIEEHTDSHKYVTNVSYDANGEPRSYETILYWYEDDGWVEDGADHESEFS